jgi:hypothetical protein
MSAEVIKKLSQDEHYYGDLGKKYLSNSDISTLLSNPTEFGKDRPDNLNFVKGRYFHQALLEPKKLKGWDVIDVSSRNTKVYKEAISGLGVEFLLLKKEQQELDELVSILKSNVHFYMALYMDGNEFEVPMIGEIKDRMWKGKADVVSKDFLIDIKTTSDMSGFRYSAKKYNYDSQCYIYQCLFDKPLVFMVIDKSSGQLGWFEPSIDFIKGGEQKVERALEVYEKFFSDNPMGDIDSYFIHETL